MTFWVILGHILCQLFPRIGIQPPALRRFAMSAFRAVRNVLGTVTILAAGYLILASLTDARRYIRISTM
jgi:hypothetical protein